MHLHICCFCTISYSRLYSLETNEQRCECIDIRTFLLISENKQCLSVLLFIPLLQAVRNGLNNRLIVEQQSLGNIDPSDRAALSGRHIASGVQTFRNDSSSALKRMFLQPLSDGILHHQCNSKLPLHFA